MSVRVRKTEHSGAKKGQGAFWGPKWIAKAGSNRLRREQGKAEVADAACIEVEAFAPEPDGAAPTSESSGRLGAGWPAEHGLPKT